MNRDQQAVPRALRRAGHRLPTWEDLVNISRWCHAARVPPHFDGTRLWEASAHCGRPLADSVCVTLRRPVAQAPS